MSRVPLRRGNTVRIDFPAVFSFIDAPNEAIAAIEEVVRAGLSEPREVFFDQKDCEHVDLCAASVLNAIVSEYFRLHKINCGGRNPAKPEAREIVRATGLERTLRVLRPEDDPENFHHFELRDGRASPANAKEASAREREATGLTLYVDRCLRHFGFALTGQGRTNIAELVGEVIDNAEEHSGTNRWWIAGYLRAADGAELGDCHITIFNFGMTLAESLQQLPEDASLRESIESLIERHRERKWFQPERWTEESLWTLYALQQNVSWKNDQPTGARIGNRGQGTVRLIRFFQALGQTRDGVHKPRMAIVSGRTHIVFDPEYKMQKVGRGDGQDRFVIAFNKENSLDVPPDPTYVRELKRYFPGTVISLRFFLDRAYLADLP